MTELRDWSSVGRGWRDLRMKGLRLLAMLSAAFIVSVVFLVSAIENDRSPWFVGANVLLGVFSFGYAMRVFWGLAVTTTWERICAVANDRDPLAKREEGESPSAPPIDYAELMQRKLTAEATAEVLRANSASDQG